MGIYEKCKCYADTEDGTGLEVSPRGQFQSAAWELSGFGVVGQNMVRWGDQVACGIPSSDAVMCALVTALWGLFPPCTNLSSRDNFVPAKVILTKLSHNFVPTKVIPTKLSHNFGGIKLCGPSYLFVAQVIFWWPKLSFGGQSYLPGG